MTILFSFSPVIAAPICPSHVQELLMSGNIKKVLVQPSNTRIFSNEEYCKVGAIVQEDLSEANIVLGIKTTSQHQMLENKTLLLFAHVIKGNNIPFLIHALNDNIRFVDYECITAAGSSNQRLVAFGEHAGMAGMIDILQGLGQQLLLSGIDGTSYSTPFLCCPRAYMHRNIDDALTSVTGVGNDISASSHATPPLIFAFTGKGHVTQGALRVFQKLPVRWIATKEELKQIASRTSGSEHCSHVYGYMVKPDDTYALKDEGLEQNLVFDNSHYRSEPFKYKSIFSQTIAPYINVLINGAYWDERYPRILTKKQINELYRQGKNR
jgi:alpha-aminoadipic semialdehyde synthase